MCSSDLGKFVLLISTSAFALVATARRASRNSAIFLYITDALAVVALEGDVLAVHYMEVRLHRLVIRRVLKDLK